MGGYFTYCSEDADDTVDMRLILYPLCEEAGQMPRPKSLVAVGLTLLLSGGICLVLPIELAVAHSQTSYQVGPDLEDNVDIPLGIMYGQSAQVTVVFEAGAESGQREIWPITYYQFPTKTVGETVRRFINQTQVTFRYGWENATYLPIFVTGFAIRLFYEGNETVEVSLTVTKTGRPTVYIGIGMFAMSIVLFLGVMLLRRNESLGHTQFRRRALWRES